MCPLVILPSAPPHCFLSPRPCPFSRATTHLLPVTTGKFIFSNILYKCNVTAYNLVLPGFFGSASLFCCPAMLLHVSGVLSFFLPHSGPLSGYTMICLSLYLLMEMSFDVFSFGLLQIKLI